MAGAHKRRGTPGKVLLANKGSRPTVRNAEDEGAESGTRNFPAVLFCIFIIPALLGLAGLLWAFNRSTPLQLPPPSWGSNSSVHERGLVTSQMSYNSVLLEHSRYWSNVSHRRFRSSVLGYVTPWNGKGYDMAKLFRSKFTHISPVWYQLKRSNTGLSLNGRHDVDEQWIKDVRHEGSPLIVPRVVLEGRPMDLLVKEDERAKAIQMLTEEIMEMQLDGIVLESWSLWRAHRVLENPTLRQKALEFVKVLGMELHAMKGSHLYSVGPPHLIFVIPPMGGASDPTSFTRRDLLYLKNAVDGVSLMTYDYSSPYSPGPNAPIKWVSKCLLSLLGAAAKDGSKSEPGSEVNIVKKSSRDPNTAGKVFMGVNFYGNDYYAQGGNSVLGHEYLSLLTQHTPRIFWDPDSQEHFLDYTLEESKEKHRVYYPSLLSISVRLEEAKVWGVGISVWELGQGLDYFFDLL